MISSSFLVALSVVPFLGRVVVVGGLLPLLSSLQSLRDRKPSNDPRGSDGGVLSLGRFGEKNSDPASCVYSGRPVRVSNLAQRSRGG